MSHFIYCYAECHYAESRYAESCYAECLYAECRYAQYHYAGCRGAYLGPMLPPGGGRNWQLTCPNQHVFPLWQATAMKC